MYPFETDRTFPRNRWYIAAFSSEITDKPMQRTLLGVPVLLYRTETEGKVVAMYGLCPHRYFPLALGKVEGDAIVCGYHGFTFNSSGKCIRIPAQGTGAGFTQPTYPVEERGTFTWIWMGDAALADPAQIPPYADFGLDQPGWAISGEEVMPLKARAQLLVDNVMDLTHLPHIHHHIPGGDVYLRSKQTVEERDCAVRLRQEMSSHWTPFFEFLWGSDARFDDDATILSNSDFYGPELMRASGPLVIRSDDPDALRDGCGEVNFMHGVTPETANTCHWFCFQTRNFRSDDAEFGKALGEIDRGIRLQDKAAVEALEEWVDHGAAERRELLVKTDRLANLVRDKIKAMIAAEENATV